MSTTNTLHELMIEELRDLYNAESQLVEALPKMAEAATTPALKQAFTNHLAQTKQHVARIEQAFEGLGESVKGKTCKAMQGLVKEGGEAIDDDGEDLVRDANLIGAARRVEHYEIAAYESTLAMARTMGHEDIIALLEPTLDEEKAADELLTQLADTEVNPNAPLMDEAETTEDAS